MSRMKVPCCSRCKMNYYVGDINGPKIPLLLKCGHDMCRNCVKFLYKRNSEVTCFICEKVDNFKFDNENKINLPVHYYKIGQVYWLTCKKQMEIHRSISNLKMTDCPTYSSESVHDVCDKCQKSANCFCHHCNVVFCYSCFDEVHTENQVMSKHIPEMIDKINIVLNSEPKCNQHFKTIEFICVTCEVNICSYCLVQSHKTHDVSTLEIYNSTTLENLTKYSNKGSLLLGKLKSTRDNFNTKMQTIHHSRSKKKLSSLDEIKHTLSLYMSTVIGALQNKEEFILDLLEQTDYADINSMNTIINQLNGLIGDLQGKLNLINHCISQNKLSSNSLKNAISDVKNMLDTSYLIVKKDKPEPSIKMDDHIFDVIQKCFTIEVDTSDTFLLRYSPDLPENYQVNVSIDINDSDLLRSTLIPSSVNSGNVFSHYSDVKNFLPVHDLVPIKEIHKNVVEPVVVTAVNTPSDFYLQLLANNSHLNMINEELKKSVNTKSNVVDKIEKNNVMYAVLTTNQYWCRCIISHIYEENGNMLYTVHCIDYGFLETVTSDKIRSVPTVLRSIPPLAYNCALYDLKPKATTGWSNDAYKLFTDLMFIKSGTFYMYPMETRGERIEVDVVWKDIYPLSIRDALFFLGYGSYEYYVNQSLHQKLVNSVTIPVSIQLEKGERYPVSLSHFVSPNEFYFHVIDKPALLEDIMNRLQKVYKPTEKEMQKSYLLYTPQIGMAVAARFSMDDTWYRAKITSIPEPRMVTVFYVDYGNSETLPWDQLRVLDEYFIKISPQALRVSLEGIIPSHNGIECSEWSIEANAKLVEMLSINHFVADSLYIFVNDVIKDGVHKVTVYNQTSRGEFCINNKLVSLGYALPTQSGAYIYNSNKNKRRPIKIKKLPVNTRNRSDSFDSDDTSAFVSQRSVIESENHIWNDKKSDSPGIEMLVIRVESPDKIILKPVQYNPTKLTDRLNKEYSKNISNKETKSNWVENDRCALFIKKFGNWYRGKILKLDENKKKATVYFYDIDETIDNVFTKSLFELEDKLFKEKCEILHCKLNNLTPLGTSNGQWAKFTSDQLSEELKKYSSVYLNKKGKEGDVVLGEIWIKDLVVPKALEPIRTRWININRFMVEQGLAMWSKKINEDSAESSSEFETNYNEPFEYGHNLQMWLPPNPLTKNCIKGYVTYVDFQCQIYFYDLESDAPQTLAYFENEFEEIFGKSEPEPLHIQWVEGQMVIARYHLDKKWYRGTILSKEENEEYVVQFLDHGNVETCVHDDLRAAVHMTDISKLCYKGYFFPIVPMTENKLWTVPILDFIHAQIVEKECKITINLEASTNDNYAISRFGTNEIPDFFQYLVSIKKAIFHNANISTICSQDIVTENYESTVSDESSSESNNLYNGYNCNEYEEYCSNEDTESKKSVKKCKEKSNFMEFDLLGITAEGIISSIIDPTKIKIIINKVDDVDISLAKNDMHTQMQSICNNLDLPDSILPGSPVCVFYKSLWRRGVIIKTEPSILIDLVDLGIATTALPKHVKLCPLKFLELPMYSLKCQLANVKYNKKSNSAKVTQKLMQLLIEKTNLKISVRGKQEEFFLTELFDNKGQLVYQNLIDSNHLILNYQ